MADKNVPGEPGKIGEPTGETLESLQGKITTLTGERDTALKQAETSGTSYKELETKLGTQGNELGTARAEIETLKSQLTEQDIDAELDLGIDKNSLKKAVDAQLQPAIAKMEAASKNASLMASTIAMNATLRDLGVKEAKDQEAVITFLNKEGIGYSPSAVKYAWNQVNSRDEKAIKEEAKQEVYKDIESKGIKLPKVDKGSTKEPPVSNAEKVKKGILDANRGHNL